MSSSKFVLGAKFRWESVAYEIVRVLQDDEFLLEDILTGKPRTAKNSELISALFEGDLYFEIPGKLAEKPGKDGLSISHQFPTLGTYPEHLIEIARYRYMVIEPFYQQRLHATYGNRRQ